MKNTMPKAFIFDLDGVLTDTAIYHFKAWKELADELGLKFDQADNERLKGVSRIRSFEIILEINNALDQFDTDKREYYANLKNDRYVELIKQVTPADILPGVADLLGDAHKNDVKCAVASASRNAFSVLASLKLDGEFDYIADAALVTHPKPHPEVFLNCAEHLGLKPCECVGVEDAQAGIEAIASAGMYSVGINVEITTVTPDYCIGSTSELDFDAICKNFNNFFALK